MVVPWDATFEEDDDPPLLPLHRHLGRWVTSPFRIEESPHTALCCSYNLIKIIISMVQLLFAIATLYRTRGDQIDRYGYAAFGLTVVPYAWMTVINLVGNAMCPQYDSMFLVESEGLKELRACVDAYELRARAKAAGSEAVNRFVVSGTVGTLTEDADRNLRRDYDIATSSKSGIPHVELILELSHSLSRVKAVAAAIWKGSGVSKALEAPAEISPTRAFYKKRYYSLLAGFYLSVVPIAIVGGLTSFAPGMSAMYQRVWTMMWLVLGFAVGFAIPPATDFVEGRPVIGSTQMGTSWLARIVFITYFAIVYAAVPIGGYVVVAGMISDFGVCFRV
jgi:hypothetical protein